MTHEQPKAPPIESAQGVIFGDHAHQENTFTRNIVLFWSLGEQARDRARRNRERMLAKVRTQVASELEHSLYYEVLQTLGLAALPEAVAHPWQLDLSLGGISSSPTSIHEAFRQSHGDVLIDGRAGAGKTTLLLQLAEGLLTRAEQDEKEPIPVVLNLSSWATHREPLEKWLMGELSRKYGVPRAIGRLWIRQEQILPLLDGLNEVGAANQQACLDEIKDYRSTHPYTPLVVCCRSDEPASWQEQSWPGATVTILPLSRQQVDQFIASVAHKLPLSHQAVEHDHLLYEVLTTPLMLCVFTLTYYHEPLKIRELLRASLATRRQRLFATYVDRMLKRPGNRHAFSIEQAIGWLVWLATQMTQRNQTELYLERLQMDWLPQGVSRRLPTLVIGLAYGFFIALAKGIAYVQIFTGPRRPPPMQGLFDGVLIGCCNVLLYVVLNGFLLPWLDVQQRRSVARGSLRERWQRLRAPLASPLGKRIVYGTLSGLLNACCIGLLVDLPAGLDNGLFFALIYGILGPLGPEIQPAEVIRWSWKSLQDTSMKFLGIGLLVGLVGLLYGVFTGLAFLSNPALLSRYLLLGLGIGGVIGMLAFLVGGVSHQQLDHRVIMLPNQGIRNSLQNSLLYGSIAWIIFGAVFALVYGPVPLWIFGTTNTVLPPHSGLIYGLTDGLAVGAFFWLLLGGTAWLQHSVLRLLLWYTKCAPLNYPRFLDEAGQRMLLQKSGGGYKFVHPLLQDYFASRVNEKGNDLGTHRSPA